MSEDRMNLIAFIINLTEEEVEKIIKHFSESTPLTDAPVLPCVQEQT